MFNPLSEKRRNTKSAFDFSLFLNSAIREKIADSSKWRWISSFRRSESPEIRHSAHERWIKIKRNTHAPAHRQIMLTIRGRAIYSLGEKLYMREPGTVILLDRYERRDFKGVSRKRDFSCLWLQIHNSDRLTYYINNCDHKGRYQHYPPSGIKTGESVRLLMEAWDHCIVHPSESMGWSFLKNVTSSLLLEVLGRATPKSGTDMQRQIIDSITEYIHAHLSEKLSLHILARISGYSPYFFHRLFVRYTGQTPVSYVNAARLIRAKQLLMYGYTVQAVAEAIGFASISYFNQFFKKQSSLAPRAWRLAQQE